MDVNENVPTAIADRIRALPYSTYYDLEMDGDDLIVTGASFWSFEEMCQVAAALGINDIDLEPEKIGHVTQESSGCDTCGYGATIRVLNARRMISVGGETVNAAVSNTVA